MSKSTRRAVLVGTAAAASLAAASLASVGTAVSTAAPAATGARSHAVTPAVAGAPHAQFEGLVNSNPSAHFGCQDTAGCYDPTQIRKAYGFDKLPLDGAGRTIVIVDAFQNPTIQQDASLFSSVFGLPQPTLNVVAPYGLPTWNASDPNQVGWSGEITLDVEWAHAIAPAAKIDLVLAKSNNDDDILAATKYAVDNDLGDVISQSFGEGETCMDPAILAAQHQVFAAATQKNITLLASAGDQGSAQPDCNNDGGYFKSASSPASDPYVTGVGGTRLVADATGAYQGESVWNEVSTYGDAGGGGFSTIYGTPAYQKRLGLSSRGVPDVAYNAAINGGVLAVWSPSGVPGHAAYYRFGGTSAGSPQWAGLVALADQMKGGRVGFLNNRIYGWATSSVLENRLFHDVTTGNNAYSYDDASGTTHNVSGYSATTGWDAATGVGSPKADRLVPQLAGQ